MLQKRQKPPEPNSEIDGKRIRGAISFVFHSEAERLISQARRGRMARHGYLREYDEDYSNEDRERALREEERDRGSRFMFGDEGRYRESYGLEHGYGDFQGDYGGGFEPGGFGGSGDYAYGRRSSTSHPDAYYHSWRNRQVRAMDRDYQDYRREREQEFHADFEAWRQQRHANPQPLQAGMTQSGLSDTTGTLELTSPAPVETPPGPDPTATATLGTTSEARRRRS
jgi:hypothetical protein